MTTRLRTVFAAWAVFLKRYRALFLVCFALLLFSGVLQSILTAQFVRGFLVWAEQAWNTNLAADFADRITPYTRGEKIDYGTLRAATYELKERAPSAEFYIIDRLGFVKLHFRNEALLRRRIIDPTPMRDFIEKRAKGDLYGRVILGDDPFSLTGRKAFSAAEINYQGQRAYLYVLLGSSQADSTLAALERNYILRGSAVAFALTVVATGIVALVVMLALARRHQSMRRAISDLTHDLKGPLASVQGYLETILLKDKTLDPAKRREFLEVALRNARSMKDMTSTLLDMSTLDDMQGNLVLEYLSIGDLLSDIVMKFNPLAHERKVTLQFFADSGSPLVAGDIRLLERALSNLVDNALRHCESGGKVIISLAQSESWAQIKVVDTGEGISSEKLPHIFDRHFSGGSARSGSRGLGLAIAKKVIELHGGSITAQSEVDIGTTFEIRLRAVEMPAQIRTAQQGRN